MSMKLSNYNKPTPKVLRTIGDGCLLLIPGFQAFIAAAPEGTFTPKELWLYGAGVSTFLVAVKFFTKMFSVDHKPATDE